MTYFLDSCFVIYMLGDPDMHVVNRFRALGPSNIKIPSMVRAELLTGAFKSLKRSKRDMIMEFLAPYETVPFDESASNVYGRIHADLEMKGNTIGPNDLIIAATVLSRGGTLITNNTREFERVEGLQIEDWMN